MYIDKLNVLSKIMQARASIKEKDLKKKGYNNYSNYPYYTPEQIDHLVWEACHPIALFNKFDMNNTEYGLMAVLTVIDLESSEYVEFVTSTDIPDIKATNTAQRLGGAMTYSKRYVLMSAYSIEDNNLDFDSKDNRDANDIDKKWLNKYDKKGNILPDYDKVITRAKDKGLSLKDLRSYYKISSETAKQIEKDLNGKNN